MQLQDSAAMRDAIAHHGAKDAQVIDVPRHVGEQFAHRDSAFAVLAKLPGRFQQPAGVPFGESERSLEWQRLAVITVEQGLRIEGIQMRRPAVHEHEDHALGAGREMRLLRRHGIGRLGAEAPFGQQPGQPHQAEAAIGMAQEMAAG